MCKIVFKIIKLILCVGVILAVIGVFWNAVCCILEKKQMKDAYGTEINVGEKKMVVDIKGKNNGPIIVLLPGYGSPSPVLEFKPIAEKLSKEYQVVTIEPFGYGLSDRTNEERTVKKIVHESHECVNKLGYEEYYLMGHSISGIYSLYWANEYPDEVKGYIGLDPSVPKMMDYDSSPISILTLNKISAYLSKSLNFIGLSRLKSIGNAKSAVYVDPSYYYTGEELKLFRNLAIGAAYNKTVINELEYMKANLEITKDMKFPRHIPVLEFLSNDNCESMLAWEQLHVDTIAEKGDLEIIRLDGSHYVHFEHPDEITKKIKYWIKE